MQTIRAEFHVHTVLSPCAEVEMLPPLIVMEALDRGIQMLAITDHNSTANIKGVQQAADGTGITVLPGMELQTREEVHVLCLFDRLEQAEALQKAVDKALPELENRPDYFGDQLIVNAAGDYISREPRLLLTSANLTLSQAWELVVQLGGLMIPAHVNRTANGLIPTLGFVPPEIPFEALEISRQLKPAAARQKFPQIGAYPLVQGGDAHQLENLLGANQITIESPTIAEIRLAFSGAGGRTLRILSTTME